MYGRELLSTLTLFISFLLHAIVTPAAPCEKLTVHISNTILCFYHNTNIIRYNIFIWTILASEISITHFSTPFIQYSIIFNMFEWFCASRLLLVSNLLTPFQFDLNQSVIVIESMLACWNKHLTQSSTGVKQFHVAMKMLVENEYCHQ